MYLRKKRLIEETINIDMRDLTAKGFKYGTSMSGKLSVNDTDISAVMINSDYMTLRYQCMTDGGWEKVKQEINLDWVDCRYGSKRAYFLCPECGERTLVLYNRGKYFYCRKCNKLAYRSQYENKLERSASKSRKIRRKLNASQDLSGIIWSKPKRMCSSLDMV